MPDAKPRSQRLTWVALAVAATAVALFAACSRPAQPGQAVRPERRSNVVVFLIDTLRRDRMGCYGHTQPTSPAMDALAAQGVLFEQAHAPAPWTCPSVPSLFTSTFLFEHGILEDGMQLSPGLRTMAERFKDAGYHTASFFVNDFAGPMNGMDRGFDIARKPKTHWVDGRMVEQWLTAERPKDQPFFLYIHNIEPHNPFNAPDELARLMGGVKPGAQQRLGRLLGLYRPMLRADWEKDDAARKPLGTTDNTADQDRVLTALHAMLDDHWTLYDAVVRHADERLASVVEVLKKHGQWEDTLFIALSDHGEEMAEHGAYLHSQSVYQELAATPLIVRFPGDQYAGTRVGELVTNIDVLPTIFSYLGRPELGAGARGIDLLPLIEGRRRSEPFIITTGRHNLKKYYKPWGTTRGNLNVALYTPDGRYKGIWNRQMQSGPGQWDEQAESFELFDLRNDPREQTNVCEEHRQLVGAMTAYVKQWYAQTSGRTQAATAVDLTPDQRASLEQLGYIGGTADGLDEELGSETPPTQPSGPGGIVTPCPVK